jgi:hypothetical protein
MFGRSDVSQASKDFAPGNMRMANFKCTWFFEDHTYNYGWTESWFVSATDADSANLSVTNYDAKRQAIMMDTSYLVNFRVTNTDAGRDSRFYPITGSGQGTIPTTGNPVAGVWDCLLIRRDRSIGDVLGHMFLHSVPAGIFSGRNYLNGTGTPAAWYTAFTAFKTEVTGGIYLLRKEAGPGTIYVPCTTITPMRRTERRVGRPSDPLRGRRR